MALTLSVDVVGSLSGIVVPCFESVLLLAFRLGQGALGVLLAAMVGSFVFSHDFDGLCPLLCGMVFALSAVVSVAFLYFGFLFGFSGLLKGLKAFRMPLLGVVVGFFFDFFVLTKGRFVFWAPFDEAAEEYVVALSSLISSFFIGMLPVMSSLQVRKTKERSFLVNRFVSPRFLRVTLCLQRCVPMPTFLCVVALSCFGCWMSVVVLTWPRFAFSLRSVKAHAQQLQ